MPAGIEIIKTYSTLKLTTALITNSPNKFENSVEERQVFSAVYLHTAPMIIFFFQMLIGKQLKVNYSSPTFVIPLCVFFRRIVTEQ
jgi:hypothetical protein